MNENETGTRQRRVGAYAKLLANYASDDAIIEAGEKAELLFVRGLAFLSTADSDGFITDAQLSRYVGAGMRDSLARARKLVEVGVWSREDGGYYVRSWTKIHETAEERGRKRKADRERKRLPTDSERNPTGVQDFSEPESLLGSSNVSGERVTEQSITEHNNRATPKRRAALNAADPGFVAFWNTYPRRVAKADALKAYTRAITRAQPDQIEAGAKRHAEAMRGVEPRFIAHPASWLNGDRWLDQPAATAANGYTAPPKEW